MKSLRWLTLIASIFSFGGGAAASSQEDLPVPALVEQASLIAEVKVVAIAADCEAPQGCGVYTVAGRIARVHLEHVVASFAPEDRIQFCSEPFLEVGHTYYVFASSSETHSGGNCSLVVGWSGAFEVRANRAWRVRSPESRITFPTLGRVFEAESVVHSSFFEELDEAINRRRAAEAPESPTR